MSMVPSISYAAFIFVILSLTEMLQFLHAVSMGSMPETDPSLSFGASNNLWTAPMFLKGIWINAVQNEQFGTSVSRSLPELVSASNIREPRKVPGWECHCDEVTAIARVWWKGAGFDLTYYFANAVMHGLVIVAQLKTFVSIEFIPRLKLWSLHQLRLWHGFQHIINDRIMAYVYTCSKSVEHYLNTSLLACLRKV